MSTKNRLPKTRGFDVWLLTGKTNLKVHRALHKKLAEVDLSLAQYETLMAIYLNPGLTQKDVAADLLAVKSNVSTHLANLEKRGLLVRKTDTSDTRVKRLTLTTEGKKRVKKAFDKQNSLVRSMVSQVSDAELKMLEDVMSRVGGGLDEILADD